MLKWLLGFLNSQPEQPEPENDTLLVWKVVEGPYPDVDEFGEEREDGCVFLEVMSSYQDNPDEYGVVQMFFDDFDSCYHFKQDVDRSMTPIRIEL